MTIEEMWYQAHAKGRAPICNRLIRLPYAEQIGMAVELAIAARAGIAGCRNTDNSVTGERVWWWPRGGKHGDWWMLPRRTMRLADRLTAYAVAGRRTRAHADAILGRISRRAARARAWHRDHAPIKRHDTPPSYTDIARSFRQRPGRKIPPPRVAGYMPVYLGGGQCAVAALDARENELRLIGRFDGDEEAMAAAARHMQILMRLRAHRPALPA